MIKSVLKAMDTGMLNSSMALHLKAPCLHNVIFHTILDDFLNTQTF